MYFTIALLIFFVYEVDHTFYISKLSGAKLQIAFTSPKVWLQLSFMASDLEVGITLECSSEGEDLETVIEADLTSLSVCVPDASEESGSSF